MKHVRRDVVGMFLYYWSYKTMFDVPIAHGSVSFVLKKNSKTVVGLVTKKWLTRNRIAPSHYKNALGME